MHHKHYFKPLTNEVNLKCHGDNFVTILIITKNLAQNKQKNLNHCEKKNRRQKTHHGQFCKLSAMNVVAFITKKTGRPPTRKFL